MRKILFFLLIVFVYFASMLAICSNVTERDKANITLAARQQLPLLMLQFSKTGEKKRLIRHYRGPNK